MNIVFKGVEPFHLLPIHYKTCGAVLCLLIKLSTGPVENGHKVIGNALHSVFRTSADVLAVNVKKLFNIISAEFYVLVNGNGLNNIENKSVFFALLFHFFQGFLGPHFAGFNVINRGNDGTHTRNLRNILK